MLLFVSMRPCLPLKSPQLFNESVSLPHLFGAGQNSFLSTFIYLKNKNKKKKIGHMPLNQNSLSKTKLFKEHNQFYFLNLNWFQRVHFLLLKVEIPLLFDAIYSCPGLALLCQVRFYFFLKGIPWSDSGVRFVTLPLFNCLCTPRRCEDRRLLSRHNIDTVRWLSRHKPLLLICPDRPCSTWMIAGVTSQIREKSTEVRGEKRKQNRNEKKFWGSFFLLFL